MDQPIACTLGPADGLAVLERYRRLFANALEGSERTPGGVRWTLRAEPGVEEEVRALVEVESGCCGFLRMQVAVEDGVVHWDLTGSPAAAEFFDDYVRLPERLGAR